MGGGQSTQGVQVANAFCQDIWVRDRVEKMSVGCVHCTLIITLRFC